MKNFLILTTIGFLLVACTAVRTQPTSVPSDDEGVVSTELPQANIPNPASVFCLENGFISEIRTAADGSQSGVCIFPDGSECDEWTYYRGECGPANKPDAESPSADEIASDGWKSYRNEALGYSFHYPADAKIITNDEPLQSISVEGAIVDGEHWPQFTISHPRDREEYRPPEDVDLAQWLVDHNLIGDIRQPDIQIDGTTAIHLRHDQNPQSYAYDRYFFGKGDQLYMILIGHVGGKEDWHLYNHFLESIQFETR